MAAKQLVTLGDSLTFAYEAEFGFDITIQGVGTFGDGFGPEVRNWTEILNDPAYRNGDFDQGSRISVTLPVSIFPPKSETLLLRNLHNWAIPGLLIDDLRRFLIGEASLLDLLGDSPDFDVLRTALELSDFSEDDDFNVSDLAAQITTETERLVLFIGGNDINSIYGTVYDGGSPGTFVKDFVDDAAFILDWVLALNPEIEIVLVSVPHVGMTPDVKSRHPTDPVNTGRVTELMRELNSQLAGLAEERGLGFADAFSLTLPLLDPQPVPIDGITFANEGSATGDLDFSWLNGELSYNFHPNTNVHAGLANEIIHAFNRTYAAGIAPLSATEVLGGLLGKSPAEIDMPFNAWTSAYGLDGATPDDDSDGDLLSAGLEFALGLNPAMRDSDHVTSGPSEAGGVPAVQIVYPVRLPASAQFTLSPSASTGLAGSSFTPIAPEAEPLPDGRTRALLPATGDAGFLRLEAIIPPGGN